MTKRDFTILMACLNKDRMPYGRTVEVLAEATRFVDAVWELLPEEKVSQGAYDIPTGVHWEASPDAVVPDPIIPERAEKKRVRKKK